MTQVVQPWCTPVVATNLTLANKVMGGDLRGWLLCCIADGDSLVAIADQLRVDHGIDVSRETVRRWINHYGLK